MAAAASAVGGAVTARRRQRGVVLRLGGGGLALVCGLEQLFVAIKLLGLLRLQLQQQLLVLRVRALHRALGAALGGSRRAELVVDVAQLLELVLQQPRLLLALRRGADLTLDLVVLVLDLRHLTIDGVALAAVRRRHHLVERLAPLRRRVLVEALCVGQRRVVLCAQFGALVLQVGGMALLERQHRCLMLPPRPRQRRLRRRRLIHRVAELVEVSLRRSRDLWNSWFVRWIRQSVDSMHGCGWLLCRRTGTRRLRRTMNRSSAPPIM